MARRAYRYTRDSFAVRLSQFTATITDKPCPYDTIMPVYSTATGTIVDEQAPPLHATGTMILSHQVYRPSIAYTAVSSLARRILLLVRVPVQQLHTRDQWRDYARLSASPGSHQPQADEVYLARLYARTLPWGRARWNDAVCRGAIGPPRRPDQRQRLGTSQVALTGLRRARRRERRETFCTPLPHSARMVRRAPRSL